jgi:NitT/TauT family transport system substrate-binding protein
MRDVIRMRNTWYRAGLSAAAFIVLGGMVSSCSGSGADAAPDKPDITVSVLPTADSAGFFIALRQGYFAAHGLNVTYVPAAANATDVIDAQLAGTYDVTGESYVSYIEAAAHSGDRLRIIEEGSVLAQNSVALYALQGSGITSVTSLNGAFVGVDTMFGTDYLLDVAALTDLGLPTNDVNFVPVNLSDMGDALRSHLIDVATLPEPYAASVEETSGAAEIANLDSSATTGFPEEGYAVTAAWATAHPSTLAAFDAALEEGQEVADTDEAAVQGAVGAFTGTSAAADALMSSETYPLGIDVARIQRVASLMQQFDLLGTSFDVRSIIG